MENESGMCPQVDFWLCLVSLPSEKDMMSFLALFRSFSKQVLGDWKKSNTPILYDEVLYNG